MYRELLLPFLLVMTASAAEVAPKTMPAKVVEQQQEESYSLKLLNTAKRARSKLQLKQDANAELKTIISAKKAIETMRLKAAADFAAQQAGLATRNVDSATLAAFESQRKKMNQRFNELVRLIDQVDRNQKTELLSEKLDALILFLDPDITAPNSSETVKQPEKLSRGAAPVRQKKTIQ
ncbi:hypothetical protein [Victivallis vadensis]|uniref:hypothetical protein n=1 Tax=Victivallis vadensis TaxID=172901 RepID=UPI000ED6DAEE|nr:hypothetical protein [Victivallis vadensis]HCG25336.1 hypothetical protein [Lentisphaeria bacterium]HCG48760.1 hypothetical protein [Lentisphaeria bacterium]